MKQFKQVFSVLFLLFFLLFGVSVVMIVKSHVRRGQEEAAFADLTAAAEQAQQEETISDGSGIGFDAPETQRHTEEPPEEPQDTPYAALYAENSDFVGWLHIDNTRIDYPVMSTPGEPEYYLYRAFDQTSSQSGTPFVGKDSTIDSDLFIVYGHNMKDDTMFGTLDRYAEQAFWEKTPSVSFTTICEEREYEIFAAVKTRVLYQDEPGYRWYYQAGDLTGEAFDELIRYLRENALYDTGITPVYGEQIMILCTCSYQEDNGRFLVAARKKK